MTTAVHPPRIDRCVLKQTRRNCTTIPVNFNGRFSAPSLPPRVCRVTITISFLIKPATTTRRRLYSPILRNDSQCVRVGLIRSRSPPGLKGYTVITIFLMIRLLARLTNGGLNWSSGNYTRPRSRRGW